MFLFIWGKYVQFVRYQTLSKCYDDAPTSFELKKPVALIQDHGIMSVGFYLLERMHDTFYRYTISLFQFMLPSINQSIYCCLFGTGVWGQQSKQRSPEFGLPSHFLQLL